MRTGLIALSLVAGLCAPCLRAEEPDALRKRVDEAVAKVYPALVQVQVVQVEYEEGREVKDEAAGSGVIISREGHVVTNHHVAGKAKHIVCRLANKEQLEATRVGTDPLADISVLKLDLSQRKDPQAPLPVAEFGDSGLLRVGDQVMAMGCPAALSQSVTLGIVSNVEMTVPKFFWPFTFKMDGEEVGTLVKWIGHDAAIYPGNSGGPLVNLDGKIVGINEIGLGLSGAIPGNLVRDVARQLIAHGAVRRSWLGWTCQPLLRSSGLETGALVSEVLKGSPAAAAGIQPGDVVLAYAGEAARIRYPEEIPAFNQRVLSTPIGATVPVELLRDGRKLTVQVTTVFREPVRGEECELKEWGITARQLTTLAAGELKRPDKNGVLVWSVRPGGAAGEAKPPLACQDVITGVGGGAVQDLAHLVALTADIVKGQSRPVATAVAFERRGERLVTVLRLGLKEDDENPGEVKKAWLPAGYQVLTPQLAEALGLKGTRGVRITQVYPNSAAAAAGLQVGDVITHLDGEAIQASQPEDIQVLAQMIRQYKIGATAQLTVRRAPRNETLKLSVLLVERPVPDTQVKRYRDPNFDFHVRDVTFMDRVTQQWDEGQGGALALAVQPGGWAALAHLAVGDLILAVDGKAVPDVKSLEERMKSIAQEKPRHVTLFVRRGIHTVFVEMEPAWPAP
jgi:serine protease Do